MKPILTIIMFCLVFASQAHAEQIKEENKHVRSWNDFAHKILALHQQKIQNRNIKVEKSKGGYPHIKDWHYKEEKHLDKDTGNLITLIQWDGDKADQIHSIEHYVYDKQGRVIRDFTAAYLPSYHNAPTQTLISLHAYEKDLHAFRTFDASGYRIVERCQGKYQGKSLQMLLDEDEIAETQYDNDSVMDTASYKACFSSLPIEVGVYLEPQ